MIAAHIENGKVVNMILVDKFTENWIDPQDSQIGYLWDGEKFSAPEIDSATLRSIDARQIRQALTKVGLRTKWEDIIWNTSQNTKDWWNYSTTYNRMDKSVTEIAEKLEINKNTLDKIWQEGVLL